MAHQLRKVPAVIAGTGSYLPSKVLTNADLEKMVDTSDEWIFTRTGIRERRIAAPDELSSDMGSRAAELALKRAGLDPKQVDLIIVGTSTPDTPFPSTACYIQHKIGAKKAAAFDITAACSGFLYSLITANQFISTGLYSNILVIGAEKMSAIINWQDRNTCVLFGDGAGAVLLQAKTDATSHRGFGFLATDLGADGAQADILSVPGGGCRIPLSAEVLAERINTIQMSGKEVYRYAVSAMYQSAKRCLDAAKISTDEIDWVVPHQANYRIIEAVAERLGTPKEKLIVNLDQYGNTSAACMPIAIDEAVAAGKFKPGDKILFVTFGGGLTWASAVLEW